jgi:hypothetical protein
MRLYPFSFFASVITLRNGLPPSLAKSLLRRFQNAFAGFYTPRYRHKALFKNVPFCFRPP